MALELLLAAALMSNPATTVPLANAAAADRPVSCANRGQPEYPFVLRQWGNNGHVVARSVIDAQGRVSHVDILESTHPGFERATLAWLFAVHCDPAIKGGQAADTVVRQRFNFTLHDRGVSNRFPENSGMAGEETYRIPRDTAPDLPDIYRYDEPPQILYVGPLVYPLDKLLQEKSGSAVVSVLIGPDGHVYKTSVLQASEPVFGDALASSAAAWRFRPAQKNQKPSWALVSFSREFDPKDRDFWADNLTDDLLSRLRNQPDSVATLTTLDSTPVALHQPAPVYPPSLLMSKVAGSALIEFCVGTDGQARLPRVISADLPEFGWAAAAAVARWRFSPPLRGGVPVDARLRIPVRFAVPDASGAPALP
jgi:TonB family protein